MKKCESESTKQERSKGGMGRCEQSRRRRARASPASENVEGLSFSITVSERKFRLFFTDGSYVYNKQAFICHYTPVILIIVSPFIYFIYRYPRYHIDFFGGSNSYNIDYCITIYLSLYPCYIKVYKDS